MVTSTADSRAFTTQSAWISGERALEGRVLISKGPEGGVLRLFLIHRWQKKQPSRQAGESRLPWIAP